MDNGFIVRLRSAMHEKGITATELSRKSGVGKSDISYYLKGKYSPKQDKCFLLAKALDVDPGWLMTGVDPNEEAFSLAEFQSQIKEWEENGVYDMIDLFLSLSEENRSAAKKYMLYLSSLEEANNDLP